MASLDEASSEISLEALQSMSARESTAGEFSTPGGRGAYAKVSTPDKGSTKSHVKNFLGKAKGRKPRQVKQEAPDENQRLAEMLQFQLQEINSARRSETIRYENMIRELKERLGDTQEQIDRLEITVEQLRDEKARLRDTNGAAGAVDATSAAALRELLERALAGAGVDAELRAELQALREVLAAPGQASSDVAPRVVFRAPPELTGQVEALGASLATRDQQLRALQDRYMACETAREAAEQRAKGAEEMLLATQKQAESLLQARDATSSESRRHAQKTKELKAKIATHVERVAALETALREAEAEAEILRGTVQGAQSTLQKTSEELKAVALRERTARDAAQELELALQNRSSQLAVARAHAQAATEAKERAETEGARLGEELQQLREARANLEAQAASLPGLESRLRMAIANNNQLARDLKRAEATVAALNEMTRNITQKLLKPPIEIRVPKPRPSADARDLEAEAERLRKEVARKTALIEHFVMQERAKGGAAPAAELKRKRSLKAFRAGGRSVKLSEDEQRVRAQVLEETLLQNIHLRANIEAMAAEVEKLCAAIEGARTAE